MSSSPCMITRVEMSAIGPLHLCHYALCVIEGLSATGHSTGNFKPSPEQRSAYVAVCLCCSTTIHLFSPKQTKCHPKLFHHKNQKYNLSTRGDTTKYRTKSAHTHTNLHWSSGLSVPISTMLNLRQ